MFQRLFENTPNLWTLSLLKGFFDEVRMKRVVVQELPAQTKQRSEILLLLHVFLILNCINSLKVQIHHVSLETSFRAAKETLAGQQVNKRLRPINKQLIIHVTVVWRTLKLSQRLKTEMQLSKYFLQQSGPKRTDWTASSLLLMLFLSHVCTCSYIVSSWITNTEWTLNQPPHRVNKWSQ